MKNSYSYSGFFFALFVLLGALGGCAQEKTIVPENQNPENTEIVKLKPISRSEFSFTIETFPHVDGSTSAHPFQIFIICELLDQPCSWTDSPWDETKRYLADWVENDTEKQLNSEFINNISFNGTHEAYVNLTDGNADLILVARLPSDDEEKYAKEKKVELKSYEIALDAFVFIVNRDNPIQDLSTEEIQKIYSGKLTEWKEAGGGEGVIQAYQRDDNSGSQELMMDLVMKDIPIIDAPNMILYGMMGPINTLSTDVLGIGYSVYYYEEFMAPNELIRRVAVDGVFPDSETIRKRTYPFTAEVYAVIREGEPETSGAFTLLRWLMSPEGQKIVEKSGYVPSRD